MDGPSTPPTSRSPGEGSEPFAEGETVVLRRSERDAHLVRLSGRPIAIEGLGVIDLSGQVGAVPGASVDWAGATYRIFRPTLSDLLGHLKRTAQIITPKDAQYLLFLAGVGPGAVVAEAGSGSGALTTVLAYSVGLTGRVVSCDRRADFLAAARSNVASAGLLERVEFRERDVATAGFGDGPFDAVLLDLPEPWAALTGAIAAVRPGGSVAAYCPTYNQLERTVQAMRAARLEEVRMVELLERSLHVGPGGTRPEFEMLGHTGFLSSGRKVAGPW